MEIRKMKIEKAYLNVDNKKLDTSILVYFDGNKEEVSVENRTIFLYLDEKEDCEYWIKISNINKDLFKNYLKNQEKILELIKNSKISLYKRKYSTYLDMEFVKKLDLANLDKDIVLPNQEAVLGYDFYSLYKNNRRLEDMIIVEENLYYKKYEEYQDTRSCSISIKSRKTIFSNYNNRNKYKDSKIELEELQNIKVA